MISKDGLLLSVSVWLPPYSSSMCTVTLRLAFPPASEHADILLSEKVFIDDEFCDISKDCIDFFGKLFSADSWSHVVEFICFGFFST